MEVFGRLDVLVNNGAIFILKGLEASVDDWQRMLSVNIMGAALMSKFASEYMKRFRGGAIVNLGSISELCRAALVCNLQLYESSDSSDDEKYGHGPAPFNIRVNCVVPERF